MQNEWDKLSEYFDVHQDRNKINPGAADNILLAWPSLFKGIELSGLKMKNLNILDFGCGTGLLSKQLAKMGNIVVGMDSSKGMLQKARLFVPEVEFINSDAVSISNLENLENKFDLILSVMTLQFVEDFRKIFLNLNKILNPGGVFAFAVFDEGFFNKNFGSGKLFRNINGINFMSPTLDTQIPVFVHESKYYDEFFLKNGYKKVWEDRPPFTEDFNRQYPDPDTNTENPEYLILVYKKEQM